ncbi:MAG TPA: helix-turn-helix domain-containing protein [Hyphomonadaceae bacterium]|nr:helix-turn-helix domain-containing protein [Hyphomonadaceae bacterium]
MNRIGRVQGDIARGQVAAAMTAAALNVPMAAIEGGARDADAVFARQVAMYLAHVAFGMSLGRVAAAMGRDRSTVGHACNLIEDKREDDQFDRWVTTLETAIALTPVAA